MCANEMQVESPARIEMTSALLPYLAQVRGTDCDRLKLHNGCDHPGIRLLSWAGIVPPVVWPPWPSHPAHAVGMPLSRHPAPIARSEALVGRDLDLLHICREAISGTL